MRKKANNYAFIDSQNVNLSIRAQGWKLDWARFRVYLREKYAIQKAFLFIGFVEGNTSLYTSLQEAGFICIFKPTLVHKHGTTKGNCDAELVLQAMIELSSYDTAYIVTGDGDFYCLVHYLLGIDKLGGLIIPNNRKYSALLKVDAFRPYVRFMNELRGKMSYTKSPVPAKKKRPHKDGTL